MPLYRSQTILYRIIVDINQSSVIIISDTIVVCILCTLSSNLSRGGQRSTRRKETGFLRFRVAALRSAVLPRVEATHVERYEDIQEHGALKGLVCPHASLAGAGCWAATATAARLCPRCHRPRPSPSNATPPASYRPRPPAVLYRSTRHFLCQRRRRPRAWLSTRATWPRAFRSIRVRPPQMEAAFLVVLRRQQQQQQRRRRARSWSVPYVMKKWCVFLFEGKSDANQVQMTLLQLNRYKPTAAPLPASEPSAKK